MNRRTEILESLLEQIHTLSRPVPPHQRLSVTRTAEELADQLVEVLHLYPEHHSVLVSTLMDYAEQQSGWRPANKPPSEPIDVPAAVMTDGDIEYVFVDFRAGHWRTRAGSPANVLYWYELPMLPE
jgi:hypothetical protein